MILQRNQGNKRIEIFIFQVSHIVFSTNNEYGSQYVLKYSLCYRNGKHLLYDNYILMQKQNYLQSIDGDIREEHLQQGIPYCIL